MELKGIRTFEELLVIASKGLGYAVRLGSDWERDFCYGAGEFALVEPAVVSGKEGRYRGRLSSEISFTLLVCHNYSTVAAEASLLGRVKRDAMSIVQSLESSPAVLEVSELEFEFIVPRISSYREVALQVTATVESIYSADEECDQLI